jgi:hypothetical protein
MRKLVDWQLRLVRFANTEIGSPFIWGETNCVALAIRAIDVQCGTDLMCKYRKHMTCKRIAWLWLKRNGSLEGIKSRLLADGLSVIEGDYMQDGDLLMGEVEDGNVTAHIYLSGKWLSVTDTVQVFPYHIASLVPNPVILGVR